LEPAPPVGIPLPAPGHEARGIRRIVAPNPGPMTYHGTNSWLVDWEGGTAVIDPGSEDPAHLQALASAAGGRLSHILLTHTHKDHLDGAETLARMTGAPLCSFRDSANPAFSPQHPLEDGDAIAGLTVLHTPGHASDHLCFAREDGILFSGDHVMGWSSSVVPPPPHGDLTVFLRQLARVRDRGDRLMLSAHGPAITDPAALVGGLIEHRLGREATILALLKPEPIGFDALLTRAYGSLKPALHRAARNNLLSHLLKLAGDGRATQDEEGWRLA